MFKYRDHSGSLAKSMTTVRRFGTKKQLIKHLQDDLDQYYTKGHFKCSEITIEPYGYDERIGWDSHIVALSGFGVLGFTDRCVV